MLTHMNHTHLLSDFRRAANYIILFEVAGEIVAQFTELRSCVEVEVAVLGSPSLISLTVSVGVKLHEEVAQFTKRNIFSWRL